LVAGVAQYPQYSIIIPAYNESARIPATLQAVVDFIRRQGWSAEVIVVNDGSRDQTAEVVRRFAAHFPEVRLVENPGNRGKGYSVRSGILQAQGEVVMFTDSDLSAPIEEATRLFAAIAAGADIAIGSRWLDKSRQTHRQPIYRQPIPNAASRPSPAPPPKPSSSSRLSSAGASIRRFCSSPPSAASAWSRFRSAGHTTSAPA
jgi:glycosyltransferase involved in cell wall biosynthesis